MNLTAILAVLSQNGGAIEGLIAQAGGIGNIITMLPNIISIVSTIVQTGNNNQQQGIGQTEAYAAASKAALDAITKAQAAEKQADADHAAHPTDDSAFDPGVFGGNQ